MFNFDEASKDSIEYFNGDSLAANVFITKYALTDKGGNLHESNPDDMHKRMAQEFSRIESKYPNPMSEDEIYELFKNFRYVIPQGSPMSGIGNSHQVQSISNCFVINPPYDSYGGILKTDQELVQIAKRRGGVGFDVSSIRPRGQVTANCARTTDGIEVFMDRFSNSCREVAQNGRRGALMLTISVHHPQIRDFVKIKRDLNRVTGANISIRLSDEFMNAVKSSSDFELRFPVDSSTPDVSELISARELWDEIIESAHACAEPGLLFWDNAKNNTPSDIYSEEGFSSQSTNPCGEIMLRDMQFCNLSEVVIRANDDLDTLLAVWLAAKFKRKPIIYDSHEYFLGVPEIQNRRLVKFVWQKIEEFILDQKINMIVMHNIFDVQQDHVHAATISYVAGRYCDNILMYQSNLYPNSIPFNSNYFVDITDFIDLKKEAIMCHKSEVDKFGPDWIPFWINEAKSNGKKVGVGFAEAFQMVKYFV